MTSNTPTRIAHQKSDFSFDDSMRTPKLSDEETPLKYIKIMNKRFDKQTQLIKNLFKESEERVLLRIEEKMFEIKNVIENLNARVKSLEDHLPTVIELKDEIKELKRKILQQENSVVATGIRITGVPKVENENLSVLFSNICNNIKINTPKIDKIYRLDKIKNRHRSYSIDDVIIVKLHSSYDKNYLLKAIGSYRRSVKRPLILEDIGLQSNAPIYVNENLTPHNYNIYKIALKLKKQNRIKSTFTRRGLVHIVNVNAEEPILIEFPEQLNHFFLGNTPYTNAIPACNQ